MSEFTVGSIVRPIVAGAPMFVVSSVKGGVVFVDGRKSSFPADALELVPRDEAAAIVDRTRERLAMFSELLQTGEFLPGEVVTLKSGSPPMTVMKQSGRMVDVAWIDREPRAFTYPFACLKVEFG